MTWAPDRIYRHDRQRESAWEALDEMPPGREFTIDDLFRSRAGDGFATYSMTRTVVNDAVALGCVELLGRLPCAGAPNAYRRAA